ncbi:catechol 2,3-dioxygenase-like lactoylglutathione lyase family enzyme [Roseibium marinum]|uniref:Catechol 2,3-dioxygenase-like lactoylglutathione lyase family enzyme n=2 Tax=Roseibium marinum TaxID=281252 RepID=A0A2S3UMN1_9HYPH|nr:catechol 2,3-dioxygenase-like lactoylglutathione lyase family enzyme [Roseibium marinum]
MQLGAFSISLAVKDLQKSKAFYEGLGFSDIGISNADNWTVLKNGDTIIGLFQGMFENNILTFNPGWDQDGQTLKDFQDVREIQKDLKAKGYSFVSEADETGSGRASFMLVDPDGNPVLVDQHV